MAANGGADGSGNAGPIKYTDLDDNNKARFDEIKAQLEQHLLNQYERTRSGGVRFKGFDPEGALDGVDLSVDSEERTRALRQEVNYLVAHALHRQSNALVNSLEHVAVKVVQEIKKGRYSPSGPVLGSFSGERRLEEQTPQQVMEGAAHAYGVPLFMVYKIGGTPADYQFFEIPPKEIPPGHTCIYIPDKQSIPQLCPTQPTGGQVPQHSGSSVHGPPPLGGGAAADADKQAWLAQYSTQGPNHTPSAPVSHAADALADLLRDQYGLVPKRKVIGYSKPYPDYFDNIPLPPKCKVPDFSKFNGSEGSSSIEHVSRYLSQLGIMAASDALKVRFFAQSLTGPAFAWYTSLPPNSIHSWRQLEQQFHMQYQVESTEACLADLAQVKQRRGETVADYVRRFKEVRSRCYSAPVAEDQAVRFVTDNLIKPLKEAAFNIEFTSLAHVVQKLTVYEREHPEIFTDRFRRGVNIVEVEDSDDEAEEAEVALAEWARGAKPIKCPWLKKDLSPKDFSFDISKTEQLFDLLVKEKLLRFPEGHKIPSARELRGRQYCKFHAKDTHSTNECNVLRRQIQLAIERGQILIDKPKMHIDDNPFPAINMVEQGEKLDEVEELAHGIRRLSLDVNMVETGEPSSKNRRADDDRRPRKNRVRADVDRRHRRDGKRYVTEDEVRGVRYQRPFSRHLLNKYEYEYQQRRLRFETEEEEYQERTGKKLQRREEFNNHWQCSFFRYCWDSGLERLPTPEDCPACSGKKRSVFKRLGPMLHSGGRPDASGEEEEDKEDKCHRPRWCPDGLNRSQKRRVQRLRTLEEAEALYLDKLRKTRPDLASRVQRWKRTAPPRRQKMVWRRKEKQPDQGADVAPSADVNMVFILPEEFKNPNTREDSDEEAPVAQLDFGPQPIVFTKPPEKQHLHMKALYLRGYINGQPTNRMMVDSGAAVNIMPYSTLRRMGRSKEDLIKTNITLNDFNGHQSEAMGVLNVDLTIGRKTVPTSFFVVNGAGNYTALLGRDWIHANCCIPSTMHQCLIQWDGDEVEVVPADDAIEVCATYWDADGQEPISGKDLDGCELVEATKNGVRLVLSTSQSD
jgi:hypothetical protein